MQLDWALVLYYVRNMGFALQAVEIDELGCVWKTSFEAKLEQIGEFFTYPPKDDRDKYHSMLAEAYLVS